jgi:hypothetical protein
MASYSSGQSAFGTKLQRGEGNSPEIWDTVANVGNINGPQVTVASVKTTSHSTGLPYDTYIPTIIDPGKVSFDLFIKTDSSGHRQLLSDLQNRAIGDWRMVFPDNGSSAWYFSAFFTKFGITSAVADVTKASCEMQLTGFVDFGF